jgi:hypothetical protein
MRVTAGHKQPQAGKRCFLHFEGYFSEEIEAEPGVQHLLCAT